MLAVYLPSTLFGIGQGAVVPLVALSATELGASVGTAALAVSVLGIGKLLGDVPAGSLAARIGEQRAMLVATGVAVGALGICLAAAHVAVLCLGLCMLGTSSAVWGLARQVYLTEAVPPVRRGRALSLLGGTQRVGLVVGPLLGALVAGPLGLDAGYWVHVVAALAAAAVLAAVPERAQPGTAPPMTVGSGTVRLGGVLRENSRVLATVGMGSLTISAVRTARQVVVPLWAAQVGMGPAAASALFGLSGALELVTVYPGGLAMDRLGRRWVATVSMLGLGGVLLALPLATTPATLAVLASLMGLANGLSSGLNMTLGADASPEPGRQVFLGVWRFLTDVGNGAGPAVIGAVSTAVALAPASMVMGGAAVVCVLALRRWLQVGRTDRPRS